MKTIFRSILFDTEASSGTAANFRYDITPKSMVSVVEPRAIPVGTDLMAMRSTWFGAAAAGQLMQLPKSSMASTVWEAPCWRFFSGLSFPFWHPHELNKG